MAKTHEYEILRRKASDYDRECFGAYWKWLVSIDGETRFRFGTKAEARSFVDWHRMNRGN